MLSRKGPASPGFMSSVPNIWHRCSSRRVAKGPEAPECCLISPACPWSCLGCWVGDPEVSGMVGLDFFVRHTGSSFSPGSRLCAVPRVGLNFLGIFVARLGRPENAPLVQEACLPILSSILCRQDLCSPSQKP